MIYTANWALYWEVCSFNHVLLCKDTKLFGEFACINISKYSMISTGRFLQPFCFQFCAKDALLVSKWHSALSVSSAVCDTDNWCTTQVTCGYLCSKVNKE